MNYQNGYNPSGFAQPPGFGGPAHPQSFPGQQQLSPQQQQQQQLYGASHVAQAQHQYGPHMGAGMPMAAVSMAPAGSMMHAGMQPQPPPPPQQQQQQQQQQMGAHHSPYTNAPYPQAIATPTTTRPQQHPAYRTSMSPPRQDSPLTPQHSQIPRNMSGPAAAPAAAQMSTSQPVTPPNKAQANAQQKTQPPLSPASKEREKERISLLLVINGELLQEVVKLQGEGKAGIPGQPAGQGTPAKDEAKDEKEKEKEKDGAEAEAPKAKKPTPHPDYIECMRRLQANLAYLAAIADRAHKPASHIPAAPAIMVAPEKMPALAETYKKLGALFPDVQPGSKPSQGAMKASPNLSAGASAVPASTGPKQNTPPVAGTAAAQHPSSNQSAPAMTEANYKQWLEEMGKAGGPEAGKAEGDAGLSSQPVQP